MWSFFLLISRLWAFLRRRRQNAIDRDASASLEQTLPDDRAGERRIVESIAQARDAVLGEQQRSREESTRENRRTRTIAWWTFGSLVVYTVTTVFMYLTTRDTLDHYKEALMITERAYVYLGFSNGKLMKLLTLRENEPISLSPKQRSASRDAGGGQLWHRGPSRQWSARDASDSLLQHHDMRPVN